MWAMLDTGQSQIGEPIRGLIGVSMDSVLEQEKYATNDHSAHDLPTQYDSYRGFTSWYTLFQL